MADNVTIPATGSGTATPDVRTVDKGGKQAQVVILDLGGAGAESLLTGSLPVTGPLTDAQLRAVPVPVSGTVATGGLTDAQLRATPVDVVGPLTDAELRATPVPVSGPLTDAQLRAVAVPVSAAALPLPTGAATEATLAGVLTSANFAAAFGTAGTPDAQVVSVQGIASMTPVQVSQATAANLNAQVVGDVAHDTADGGNPVKVGGFGADMGVTPTAVSASDRVRFIADRAGVQFVLGGGPDVLTLEAEYTTAQTDTAIVSVSSGTAIEVLQIQVVVDEATTVGVGFRVGFGASTTPTTTGVVASHPGMVPGSGISRGDGHAVLGVGASGEDLRITSEVPTTGALRVLVSYRTIAIG